MSQNLTLVSHTLCPYVQRAAIVLLEKNIPFERIMIDLANKPDWFQTVSPLGKVPLLKTRTGDYLFESAPIVEFLDETLPGRLHPEDPLDRARHRAYIEFASQVLNGIGALYNAGNQTIFEAAGGTLRSKFEHLDDALNPTGPFFAGERFSLVDAAFGPVFRYFDVFEEFLDLGLFQDLQRVLNWRTTLAARPSVKSAVTESYNDNLRTFLKNRGSRMSELLAAHQTIHVEAAE